MLSATLLFQPLCESIIKTWLHTFILQLWSKPTRGLANIRFTRYFHLSSLLKTIIVFCVIANICVQSNIISYFILFN